MTQPSAEHLAAWQEYEAHVEKTVNRYGHHSDTACPPWSRAMCSHRPTDLPKGIDYDRWAPLIHPSPRSAFADPLDLPDAEDDS